MSIFKCTTDCLGGGSGNGIAMPVDTSQGCVHSASFLLLQEYAVNCSEVTLQRLWSHMDVFILCHFFGWVTKALLIRHYGILWTISVMWEITEVGHA